MTMNWQRTYLTAMEPVHVCIHVMVFPTLDLSTDWVGWQFPVWRICTGPIFKCGHHTCSKSTWKQIRFSGSRFDNNRISKKSQLTNRTGSQETFEQNFSTVVLCYEPTSEEGCNRAVETLCSKSFWDCVRLVSWEFLEGSHESSWFINFFFAHECWHDSSEV